MQLQVVLRKTLLHIMAELKVKYKTQYVFASW